MSLPGTRHYRSDATHASDAGVVAEMRVVVVDLLCNSPFYCGPLVKALCDIGVKAELASPEFYLEPGVLARYARSPWIVDLTVHAARPRVVRLLSRACELPCNLTRLRRAIHSGQYDAVHVQWIPMPAENTAFMSWVRTWCDRARVPLIFTAHNVLPHDNPAANRETIRKGIDMAHSVIVHTAHVADSLQRDIGVRSDISVIPLGPLFADCSLPSKEQARARLGLGAEDRPVVLFQGGGFYKGLDLLVEGWPRVRASHPCAVLNVLGQPETRKTRSKLARLAEMPGVRLWERYVSTDLLLHHFAACDTVVFPYRAISQSAALMTAVGLGKPTVVTPLAGFLEQVAGLKSVVVAREVDGPAVAEALSESLEHRDRLAEEARLDRHHVLNSSVGWPSIARRTLDTYLKAGTRR